MTEDEQLQLVRSAVLTMPLKSRDRDEQIDEAIQDGWFGLRYAMAKYDPSRGVPFRAYATQRIRGAVIDAHRIRNGDKRVDYEAMKATKSLNAESRSTGVERHQTIPNPKTSGWQRDLETKEEAERVLSWLRPGDRVVARDYYLLDRTMKEIASARDCVESTVSKRLKTIKEKLFPTP